MPEIHVLKTGPVAGGITLDDGTVVDVTGDYISLPTKEMADEVSHKIGLRLSQDGHPDDPDFIYTTPEELQAMIDQHGDPIGAQDYAAAQVAAPAEGSN